MKTEDIIAHIRQSAGALPVDFTAQSPVFSSGILDSFDLIDLLSLLERETGKKISAAEVSLENFDTPERITKFMEKLS